MHPRLAFSLVGLMAVVAAMLVLAPVSVADRALAWGTEGRLRLADTGGTLWEGSGRLVLADVSVDRSEDDMVVQGLVLPGTLQWQVRLLPLFVGMLDASLRMDGMSVPLRLQGSLTGLSGNASGLELPVMDLGRLGSPWNTIRPAASLVVRWESFRMSAGRFEGRMSLELHDVSSAMSPVRPLGSYRIEIASDAQATAIVLNTILGPLRLVGQGAWTARSGLQITVDATADAPERERLTSFLGVIGRKNGDRVTFKIGG
jgi:general secretion pathway protein N